MKVACLSDTHGELPDIEPCDLLVIAGDVAPADQSHEPSHQMSWVNGVFSDWLENQPVKNTVWIAGNHDFFAELSSFTGDLGIPQAHYLRDNGIRLQGKNIWGYPWTANLSNWAFYAKTSGFEKAIKKVPRNTDILILHSPPCHVTEKHFPYEWLQPTYNEISHVIRPELVVFGHIHEGYGMKSEFGTHWVNAAYRDEMYDPVNSPIYVDLPDSDS